MELRSEGFTAAECLDFDFAVRDFYHWEESRKNEMKWARRSRRDDPPGRNFKQVPRYDTMQEVWAPFNQEPEETHPDVWAANLDDMMDWSISEENDPWATL
jgi:hypothetical protein